jgi:hypothetical protein
MYLLIVLSFLRGVPPKQYIGIIKTLLQPGGSKAHGVIATWNMGNFMDQLRTKLSADAVAFLNVLTLCVSERRVLKEMEQFDLWKNQAPLTLDTNIRFT